MRRAVNDGGDAVAFAPPIGTARIADAEQDLDDLSLPPLLPSEEAAAEPAEAADRHRSGGACD